MTLSAGNSSFKIPPGDPNFRVDASLTHAGGRDAARHASAHAHARQIRAVPDRLRRRQDGKLLNVPRYNWHWQLWYDLAEPLKLPKGTKLECTEHFDNSPNNPENPDPTRR